MRKLLLLAVLVAPLWAQSTSHTAYRFIATGTSLPATCTASASTVDVYALTTAGTAVPYFCSATNTWTSFGSGSGSSLDSKATYKATAITPQSNGSTIQTIPDVSGYANDCVQATAGNRPTYQTNVFGTIPSVRFALGVPQYCYIGNNVIVMAQPNVAVCFVARINVSGEGSITMPVTLGSNAFNFQMLDWPHLTQLSLYSNNAGTGYSGLLVPARLSAWCISEADQRNTFGLNQANATSAALGASATGAIVTGQMPSSNFPISMDLVEFRAVPRQLSRGDYQAWMDYAEVQYGVYAGPVTAQVFGYGNSITAGHGIADGATWPNLLKAQLTKTTEVYNLGRSSAKTTDLTTNYATTLAPFYDAAKTNVAVLWEVRNDVCNANTDAATAYANYVALAQAAKATGFRVVAVTTPPSGGCTAPQLAAIVTVNTNVSANFVGSGYADVVVDLAGNACLADNVDATHACYQADTVHPNSAGQAVVAGLLKAALTSLGVN